MPYHTRRKNNALTTLSGTLAQAATSCSVSDASKLPAAPFICTIWDRASYPDPGDDAGMEIVYCYAVSGNTLSILRGQESTADVAHADGESIAAMGTAGIYADQRDSAVRWAKAALVDRIHGIVTATSNIRALWLFDAISGTTVSDLALDSGHTAHNLTLSSDASGWVPRWDGMAGTLANTTSTYFTTPDHADFTFGNGSADLAFSILCLVNPSTIASRYMLAKIDDTTGTTHREWRLGFSSGSYLEMMCRDDSSGKYIGRQYAASLAGDIGAWHCYIMTKSTAVTSSAIKLYRDSVRCDDTNYESATYTAMEDTSAAVGNYIVNTSGSVANVCAARWGLMAVIAEELTQTQVTRLDRLCRGWVGVAV